MPKFEASAAQILKWITWYVLHQATLTDLNVVYQYYLGIYQDHRASTPDKKTPRNPNSFFVFRTALTRSGIKPPSKIGWSKIAGTIWSHLKAAERRPYEEMAAKIKKVHRDIFTDYVYKPERKPVSPTEADETVGWRDSVGPQRQAKTRHDRKKAQNPYRSPEPGGTLHWGECQVSSFVVDNYERQRHSHLPNPVTSHHPTPALGGSRFHGSYEDAATSSAFATSAAPAPVIVSTPATRISFSHTPTSPRPAVTVAVAPTSSTPPLYAAPRARAAHEGGSAARESSTRTYRAASAPASLPTTSYIAPPLASQAGSPHHDVHEDRRSYSPYALRSANWDNAPIAQQPSPSPPNATFSLPPCSTLYHGQAPPQSPLPSTSSYPLATSQSEARSSQWNIDPGRVFDPYINEDAFETSAYHHGDAPIYHHHPGYTPGAPQADTWPIPTAETSQGAVFDQFSWMMSPSQGASGWSQEAYNSVMGVLPWGT